MDDVPTVEMDNDTPMEDWVVIRNCGYTHEADLIVAVLEAEGIDTFVPDSHMASIRPELSGFLGGIRVLVRESDVDFAEEVLTAEGAHDLPDDSLSPDDAS